MPNQNVWYTLSLQTVTEKQCISMGFFEEETFHKLHESVVMLYPQNVTESILSQSSIDNL